MIYVLNVLEKTIIGHEINDSTEEEIDHYIEKK